MDARIPNLTALQEESWTTQGFFVLEGFFDPAEVRSVNENLFRLLLETAAGKGAHPRGLTIEYERAFDPKGKDVRTLDLGVRKYFQFAERDPWFWHLYTLERFKALIRRLTGEDGRFLQSMALVKAPEIGSPKSWHQDSPYFPVTPAGGGIGYWVALDEATPENGCMQVIPASHKRGLVAHIQGETGWKLPDETIDPLTPSILKLPMKAGSALVFSPLLFHFTDANRSTRRRRALQFHYTLASTRTTTGDRILHSLDEECPPGGI